MAGGAIGAMHIPEKWFPGSMDYYLNSHNIMHVLVVLAVYSMHQVNIFTFGDPHFFCNRVVQILGHRTGPGLDVKS